MILTKSDKSVVIYIYSISDHGYSCTLSFISSVINYINAIITVSM